MKTEAAKYKSGIIAVNMMKSVVGSLVQTGVRKPPQLEFLETPNKEYSN